jgi:hypothetical protein
VQTFNSSGNPVRHIPATLPDALISNEEYKAFRKKNETATATPAYQGVFFEDENEPGKGFRLLYKRDFFFDNTVRPQCRVAQQK